MNDALITYHSFIISKNESGMSLESIKKFVVDTFGDDKLISEREIEQLSWSVREAPHTPEKDVVNIAQNNAFIEVRRCLSRLHCLKLLQSGPRGFKSFIQSQDTENDFNPVLSDKQYNTISQKITSLDHLAIDALHVSTVLSSVPLSPKARKNADDVLGENNYTFDSVEFLADTFDDIENAKKIYPLVNSLFQAYPKIEEQQRLTKYLQSAFCHRQHYRHMLYTEGNENMFRHLLAAVKEKKLDKEAFHFWVCHWTINITGFRGHLSPKGSLYLTSNTFKAMAALESVLETVFSNPKITPHELLSSYLDIRAGFLKLDRFSLPPHHERLLAHIGAMMRLYQPMEGETLVAGFYLIPIETRKKLAFSYFNVTDKEEPTPTFAPALFENSIDYRKNSYDQDSIIQKISKYAYSKSIVVRAEELKRMLAIADVVVGCLPVYLRTLDEYRLKRQTKTIDLKQPLSFQAAAAKKDISELCGKSPIVELFDVLEYKIPKVDEKGIVSFENNPTLKPLSEQRVLTPLYQSKSQDEYPGLRQTTQTSINKPKPSIKIVLS